MRLDNNSFDDSVRKKLQEDEEPVSGALWGNISKEIPVGSSNRKRVGYYLITALLLISSSAYYFIDVESKTEIVQAESSPALRGASEQVADISNSTPVVQYTKENKSQKAINTNNIVSNSTVTSNQLSQQNNKPQSKKKAAKKSVRQTHFEENLFANDTHIATLEQQQIKEENFVSVNASTVENPEQVNETLTQNTDSTVNETQQDLSNQSTAEVKSVISDSSIIAEGLKNNVGIEISFSPDFIFKKWSVNTGTQEYLNTRKETESFAFAHTYGAKIYFKVAKGVFLKTGIYLSEVTELLHYSYLEVEPNDLFTKLGGNNGTWFNPLTNQTTGDTTVSNFVYPADVVSTNNYKYYNIPIQIAFYKDLKRFRVGVSAGAAMNYSFRQKGSIMKDDKYGKIILSDKNRSPYKSTIGLGITSSVFASYKIRKNVNFFLEPEYRVYLNPISKKDAPLTEKLSTLSIMSGLQFEF